MKLIKHLNQYLYNKMNYKNYSDLGKSRIKFLSYIENIITKCEKPFNILETGCTYNFTNETWAGMTYIFANLIEKNRGGNILTIDINEEHINKCKQITKDFSSFINYKLGDSVNIIRNLTDDYLKSLDLVFLDSYDLNIFNPTPSAIHHLKELLFLIDKINPNCLIAIDDNFLPNTWIQWNWDDGKSEIFETKDKLIGKGMFCNEFLLQNGWMLENEILEHGANNIFLYKLKKSL